MDLRTGCEYWTRLDSSAAYQPLDADARADVAIVGGGITGALVAHHLAEVGASVIVLDRRQPGQGSTAASSALILYEIDKLLVDLIQQIGADRACRAYRISAQMVQELGLLAGRLDDDAAFSPRPSLYLAVNARDVPILQSEHAARRKIGIEVDFLPKDELRRSLGINRPAALWSSKAAAVDPLRLTHALLRSAGARGAAIHGDTTVNRYDADDTGVMLHTDRRPVVRARKVVFATGYETPQFVDRNLCSLRSTYAIVSRPTNLSAWPKRCLIWEYNDPYLYCRTTPDGRALVGGADEQIVDPEKRDALIDAKSRTLRESFHELLPRVPIEIDCGWAGTFAQTKDGLPYIGTLPEFPNGYFALGYGGNGITFSLLAAQIIRDLFTGRPNPDAEIFRFGR